MAMLPRSRFKQLLRGQLHDSVCFPCLFRLTRVGHRQSRPVSSSSAEAIAPPTIRNSGSFRKQYFLGNDLWDRYSNKHGSRSWKDWLMAAKRSRPLSTTSNSKQETARLAQVGSEGVDKTQTLLPHRRRRKKIEDPSSEIFSIPPDASSQLSALSSTLPAYSFRQRFFACLSLSKPRLTFLMVLTTTTAYSLFPVAVSPMASSMDLSPLTLLNLTAGTALSSACANALNMWMEPVHDAKMSRTRTRPLVRGLLSSRAALIFAGCMGLSGVALLYYGVNPTVAGLSALNIFLYAGVYTPLKRISIINTWAGAVVGGIPPLMGWAAAASQASSLDQPGWRDLLFDPEKSAGGWLFAALLFAWQFPHFNAIAYTIRHEYAAAGYRMLASFNTRKNALIALRYSLAMFPICAGLSYVGVVGWSFVGTSGVVNAWMTREAWRFFKHEGAKGTAKGLFWASVWHLPLILVLSMAHKKGLWERFFRGGLNEEELEEYGRPITLSQAGDNEKTTALLTR